MEDEIREMLERRARDFATGVLVGESLENATKEQGMTPGHIVVTAFIGHLLYGTDPKDLSQADNPAVPDAIAAISKAMAEVTAKYGGEQGGQGQEEPNT